MILEKQLLSTFAHDLRQALRAMTVNAQRLQRQANLDADGAAWVENLLAAAQSQGELITSVVEYNHALHEGMKNDARMSLQLAIQTACLKIEPYRQQRNGKILIAGAAPPVSVPAGLAKVVERILHNALKFHRNGALPEVQVELNNGEGSVDIRVSDNGIGADPKYFTIMFQPFAKLNPSGEFPGSGMGLPICLRMMESIGGSILVEDHGATPGVTVVVRVPVST